MADLIRSPKLQGASETRTYDVDFSNDCRTGVTLSSATASHKPPSGTAATPSVGSISGNIAPVTLALSSAGIGDHFLDVTGTLSDGETPVIRIVISVEF